MFLAKYDNLALYDIDMGKISIIDHEQLPFDKNSGWALIGNPEEPDSSLLDHEYFSFMMTYCIEFNQLIRENNSCGNFYQINQMKMNKIVKQQRYMITRSKRRRGLLPKNHPSILFREIVRNFQ